MGEIQEYLDISKTDVADKKLNANTDVPLFINTLGAWAYRPRVKARTISNLYFAGDWVRNQIDLACMEGAVFAALSAAKEMCEREGMSGIPAPKVPQTHPSWLLRLLKWALAPAMVLVHVWSRLDPQ
jgi:uncharacterized protein with NAD-binding domain and iron-sulfur cluster